MVTINGCYRKTRIKFSKGKIYSDQLIGGKLFDKCKVGKTEIMRSVSTRLRGTRR